MKILALDLGKYKTVGCDYESESGAHQFKRGVTTPAGLAKMVQEIKPDRVVIEVCSMAGWVCHLLWGVGIEVQVANTSDDAWRWRKVKQKDDRRDPLKQPAYQRSISCAKFTYRRTKCGNGEP